MSLRPILWIAAAFGLIALPFVALVAIERGEGREFLWDFSKGLGFGALAMAGLQFALTARFRRLAYPFGMDVVYLFHRYLALGAVVLMLAHIGILYFWYEGELGVLNPVEARWELTAGRAALVCFVGLAITSELRKFLRLNYETWRPLHVGLAILGFGLAVAHVLGVGQLTAHPATRALWIGVTVGWLFLLLWVRLIKPAQQRANPWKVVENRERRGGVHSLIFEPQGKPLPKWKPGQFAWLTLEGSPFGLREHPFTISSAPEHGPNVTMSIKALGDFTARAVETSPGAIAYLDGPYGRFSIDCHPDVPGYVMIAGGVGITPMMSNLHAMLERGDRRPVVLFYANPGLDDVAFHDELAELEQRMNLTLLHVLEEPPSDWAGESGFIDVDILKRHLPKDAGRYQHFLCGPPPMTEAAAKALASLGVPLGSIDTEIFEMV